MVVTETGYQNALSSGSYAVTEATAADYTLRTLLDALRLGIPRTYLYELLDEQPESGLLDPEQHYGLVRADGTVKPAYTAVQNLLTDLAQGPPANVGPSAPAPATFDVTMQGGGSLLRSMVVTDPNGAGQTVALWLATPLENTATHTRTTNTARTVRLSLDGRAAANRRKPSRADTVVNMGVGTAFDVPVDGAVTLVHLNPTSRPDATSCTPRGAYADVADDLGATASNPLDATTGWSGTPTAADPPAGLSGATEITGPGQQTHVSVPASPGWTVTVWERTASRPLRTATFLQATGAAGGLLRTYNLSDDVPSHVQVSAYGLPVTGAGYGTETWGQALPGTWHLLSLSVAGSSATLAVDAVAQGTVASSHRALNGVDVGSLAPGFRGALGGLEVFPRALTADELGRLATAADLTC